MLFGIQGTTEDEDYHENVSIENNARLLTGMFLDMQANRFESESYIDWFVSPIVFTDHTDSVGRDIYNRTAHFDFCQVPDALKLGVMSMNYGGWDKHNNEAFEIGANLEDIFGAGKGLATAMTAVQTLPFQDLPASSQLVFYFASDFGRQIMANGSSGTDHGRGSYSILTGDTARPQA